MVKIVVGGKVVTEKQLFRIRSKAIEKSARLEHKKTKARRTKKIPKATLKKSKTTLHIKQVEAPSILTEPGRFFKNELEEAKHALFFR